MSLKINDSRIDWTSSDSHYFFNPSHPEAQKLKELASQLPFLKEHIYLFTSSYGKICLLSKAAFLHSAKIVNKNLQVQSKDKWLISLPLFHIAGLSILSRSFCGGFTYEQSSSLWSAKNFKKELEEKKINLCSLVPAQIYDLVKQNLKAPKSLRAVLVGGDALSPLLYKKARKLSWPILISYGLTEACSQVACSDFHSLSKPFFPKMKILDHIEIKTTETNFKIKSKSLLTAYFDSKEKKFYDPKDSKGWLKLQDEIFFESPFISIKGRIEEEVKILGERVSLKELSFLLENLSQKFLEDYQLIAMPDKRQGFKLVLLTDSFDFSKSLCLSDQFNAKVLPFEKIQSIYCVSKIKKSELLKVRQKEIITQLGF